MRLFAHRRHPNQPLTRAAVWFGPSIAYPLSFYILIILLLLGTIVVLIPAINLRKKLLRLQISDEAPFLGVTKFEIDADGLIVERPAARSK